MFGPIAERWPDLVVTIIGAIIGGFIAFWIALYTLRSDQRARERRDREELVAHMDRIKVEIRDNQQTAKELVDLLGKRPGQLERIAQPMADAHSLPKIYRWAASLAATLSVEGYEDLRSSGLQRLLPDDTQRALFSARQDTVNLRAAVFAAERAWEYYNWQPPQAQEDHYENLLTVGRQVRDALAVVKPEVYACADELRRRGEEEQRGIVGAWVAPPAWRRFPMRRWVTGVGLILVLGGAGILWHFGATRAETNKPPRIASQEIADRAGREIVVQTGWSGWGFGLIFAGTVLQFVALWIPEPAAAR